MRGADLCENITISVSDVNKRINCMIKIYSMVSIIVFKKRQQDPFGWEEQLRFSSVKHSLEQLNYCILQCNCNV